MTLILFLSKGTSVFAQDQMMAETFRSEGKIYVVLAVIGIILIGLFMLLFLLERRLKKLEEKPSKDQIVI